jgi:hypothetical protein
VIGELDELWRRSGGTLSSLSPEEIRIRIREQLERVASWEDFLRARIVLEPSELVDEETRKNLDALPGRLHIRGDAVPLDYGGEGNLGVARVRLREGQAKRLRPEELPRLDRPLRFAVQQGHHTPILADSIPVLQTLLQRAPRELAGEGHDSGRVGGRRDKRRHGKTNRGSGRPPGRSRR